MDELNKEELKRASLRELRQFFAGSPGQMTLLMDCLSDPSWRVRKDAVEFCHETGGDTVIAMLIQGLASEDNAGMRNACQEALTRIGAQAGPHLVGAFRDADGDVRKFILDIMGDTGSTAFCDFIVHALGDPDENVVIACCENLGKIGCPEAVSALLTLLDPQKQWLSFVIIESLAQIAAPLDALKLMPMWEIATLRKPILDLLPLVGTAHDVDILKKAFSDSSPYVQEAAARSLYRLLERSPERLGEFKAGLAGQIRYNQSFKKLLGTQHEDQKTFALLAFVSEDRQFLADHVENCGDEALEFFGSLAGEASFENNSIILELLNQYDERKQAYLVYLCGILRIEGAIDTLIPLAASRYGHTRQAVAFALAHIGGERAVPPLFQLLADEYPDVREQAVRALSMLVTPETFPHDLAAAIYETGDPRNILALLDLMKETGCFEESYIRRALNNHTPAVRAKAIEIIGEQRLTAFLHDVVIFLTDNNEDVLCRAIETIGNIGSPENADLIAGFLGSGSNVIKKAALLCLNTLAPVKLPEYENLIFGNVTPLQLLTLMDFFDKGTGFSTDSLSNAALAIDDRELYTDLIGIFLKHGLQDAAKKLTSAVENRKGKDFLPAGLFTSSDKV